MTDAPLAPTKLGSLNYSTRTHHQRPCLMRVRSTTWSNISQGNMKIRVHNDRNGSIPIHIDNGHSHGKLSSYMGVRQEPTIPSRGWAVMDWWKNRVRQRPLNVNDAHIFRHDLFFNWSVYRLSIRLFLFQKFVEWIAVVPLVWVA